MASLYSSAVLIVGRGLHAPWNEGARVFARDFARATSTLRETHVLSLTQQVYEQESLSDSGVDHVFTKMRYGPVGDYVALGRLARRVAATMSETPIGVVHLIGVTWALSPVLQRLGARVVVHVTLVDHPYIGAIERARAAVGLRAFARWIDAYSVSSASLAEPLVKRGVSPSKLSVIPVGIDTARYAPVDRREARSRLGVASDSFTVVYIGSLFPLRFPTSDVCEALAQTRRKIDAPMRFVGFAPAATHEYNRAFSEAVVGQLASVPGVTTEISFVDLSETHKIDWYAAADAVILPFAGSVAVEPPLTLLEAMACDAPVVVRPHANHSGLVKHEQTGWIFESAEELGDVLANIFHRRDSDYVRDVRAAARATVIEHHSLVTAASAAARTWAAIEK